VNPVRNTMYTNVNPVVSNGVKIIIKNFQKKIPINPTRIKKTILRVLSSQNQARSGEITISFVNEGKIKELNKKYLGKDSPTDVLAFDISEPDKPNRLLADIIICAEEALKNAKIFKTTVPYELNLYAVHGILHILGFNDHTQKQAQLMRKLERKYVNT